MSRRIKNSVIRDTLLGNRLIDAPRYIRAVIDTPQFQRLRSIRQTGLTSYVFPSAEHSRFAHSIGVFATAARFFSHLRECSMDLAIGVDALVFDDINERDFTIAALIHDIGHTAFSHVLETNLLPADCPTHEDCTKQLLSNSTDIAKAINNVADRAAVYQLIDGRHPNLGLNDLVSSTFDVDRCDYVLRDSALTGVEYGTYDLSWLVHSLSVDIGSGGQPLMLLDGPRGLDALKQFLSGRRYLYRQVYYHAAVRGAQQLLKAIFERIQQTKGAAAHLELAPKCLHATMAGKKPELDEFLRTTDIEILFMVKEFADYHPDQVLQWLCRWFMARQFPKAILNAGKLSGDLTKEYRILPLESEGAEDAQLRLFEDGAPAPMARDAFTADIVDLVRKELVKQGLPAEIADYLVTWDAPPLPSMPAPNLKLRYDGRTLSFDDIADTEAGREFSALLTSFTIERFYAPRAVAKAVESHVRSHYRLDQEYTGGDR